MSGCMSARVVKRARPPQRGAHAPSPRRAPGMMVYIAVTELLPAALRYDPRDVVATRCFWMGAAVMASSLMLFSA